VPRTDTYKIELFRLAFTENATGNLLNNPTLFENNTDYFNELIRRIT